MLEENTTVSIYSNPDQVQEVLIELNEHGFDLKRVSIVGKAYRDQKELVAYYKQGDKLKCWGERSEFWNGLRGMLREWVQFSFGMSALGATLYSMGLARDRVQDCEEALRNGSYLLIVHGPAQEVMKAKRIIKSANIMLSK